MITLLCIIFVAYGSYKILTGDEDDKVASAFCSLGNAFLILIIAGVAIFAFFMLGGPALLVVGCGIVGVGAGFYSLFSSL